MSFLTPLFLFGLVAAAIPLAIHLIRRENPPKVMFGSLRFLKQTTRKLVLFQQIQQWVLLLLRGALICLLVLAFARPLLHQGQLGGLVTAEPESVVILLDSSLAMRLGDRFEHARDEALEVLNGLSPGDEAAVVRFSDSVRQATELTTDVDALRATVTQNTEPEYHPARFYPALRLANDLLSDARHERRRIVMISSFPGSGITGADAGWMLDPGVGFATIAVEDQQSRNLSLTDVRAPQQLLETEQEVEVLARVRSTGNVVVERGELTLLINGTSVATEPVTLGSRSEAVLSLPVSLDGSGLYSGELVLSDDDFPEDNHWYFTLDILPRMQVLVVNGAPSSNWFDDAAHWFGLALEGPERSPFNVTYIDWRDLERGHLVDSDAVVLLNVPALPQALANDISEFVSDGGALLLAPGNRVQSDAFNDQLGDLSPLRLADALVLPGNDYLLIADVDRRHPALRALDVDWSARFQGYWQTEPGDAESGVLMRFDSGDPLLAERRVGNGHVMLVTTSLDLAWSNFPLQGLYLPFVHELLSYMVQPPGQERSYAVGDTIDMTELFAAGQQRVTLREPDGSTVDLLVDNPYYQARLPGLIEVSDNVRYAVNVNAEAALLTSLDVDLLYDSLINPETTPQVSERVRTAQLMVELEQPQRLWWWILLTVVLLLVVEGWVANRTYR